MLSNDDKHKNYSILCIVTDGVITDVDRALDRFEAFRVRVSLVWGFLRISAVENLLIMEVKVKL